MKKYVLLLLAIVVCHTNYTEAMNLENTKDALTHFNDVTDISQKIQSELAQHEFATMYSILNLAESGDEKAFQVILKLFDDPSCGLGFTVATEISEKKFISPSMVETLSKIKDVDDALMEIENGDKAAQIILERTGEEKHWFEVFKKASDGDKVAFAVINELLEKRYLLDLPFVIAEYLQKGLFVNEEMKETFLKNKSVQKNLKRLRAEEK